MKLGKDATNLFDKFDQNRGGINTKKEKRLVVKVHRKRGRRRKNMPYRKKDSDTIQGR